MGKKKQVKDPGKTQGSSKEGDKGKKVYSISHAKEGTNSDGSPTDQLEKVSIPADVEKKILAIITTVFNERQVEKEVSGRLTSKKLLDLYGSLSGAGFNHKQIEQAMNNTVIHGGDLIDALDWLCLNLTNDELPSKFSQALQTEEAKSKQRPKFDEDLQQNANGKQRERKNKIKPQESQPKKKVAKATPKEWILRYAEMESESEDSQEDDLENEDPNERYLELSALLLDARELAAQAKVSGNKTEQKEASKKIRDYMMALNELEKHPEFNPAIKIDDLDNLKPSVRPDTAGSQTDKTEPSGKQTGTSSGTNKAVEVGRDEEEEEDMGLAFFQDEPVPAEDKKDQPVVVKVAMKVRRFEYTRQQWTGKSPKQFLIDWCRKHLPKSPPPKFEKLFERANKFRCKGRVERKEGALEVCPDILCENVKEAEHVAATLALYHLCKGQSVHQLLPPPYRDVWLEWLEAENQKKQEKKSQENKVILILANSADPDEMQHYAAFHLGLHCLSKYQFPVYKGPRDQYISKLLSRIQLTEKESVQSTEATAEDTVDSWETLEDDSQQDSSVEAVNSTHGREPSQTCLEAASKIYINNSSTQRYKSLLKSREELPVFQYQGAILAQLKRHSVVLIAGETGCGKSTQIPHYILKNCLMESSGSGQTCNIVCTEPRRISAISLAKRVSEEMGEKCIGNQESLCGYQIRFESKRGPYTRLSYCTTGVILRQLQLDPMLKDVSHIIVDEVHERSVQSDFLLIILKRLLDVRQDLKVILMSATIDADRFSAYFSHCPVINIPGRIYPVEVYHIEDVIEEMKYVIEDDSPYVLRQGQLVQEEETSVQVTEKGGHQAKLDLVWTKDDIANVDYTSLSSEVYSLKTRNTVTRLNLQRINRDLIVDLLVHLETDVKYRGVTGAVLIFLPGLADITELYEMLQSDQRFNDKRHWVIALHSILSSADQQSVFNVPPSGVRKIVLATNIAETGITIPDVVFVIDAGKVKENRYNETSEMNVLEEVFTSKANAKQRKGRAGRVREGYCFRLYTKKMFENMRNFSIPELLRVPLEELCLNILKCEYGDPEEVLGMALDPPQPQTVNRAITLLHSVGACSGGKLTPLGHHLAALPVHVRLGKMLLYGAVFDCLQPVAVIAAAMTDKSPFVAPVGKQDMANMAKQALAIACSDQLTIYKSYIGWEEARSRGQQAELAYCNKNFLNRKTLLEIQNVKSDLVKLVQSIGFDGSRENKGNMSKSPQESDLNFSRGDVLEISKFTNAKTLDERTIAKIKAVLLAGLYPNIAKVSHIERIDAHVNPELNVCVGVSAQGPVHVHPSSVNRFLQANGWLVFHQKVKSSRVYIRDCSLVSPYALLLFGGDIQVMHTDKLLTLDDNVKYTAYAKTGVMFKELRKLLDSVLERKLNYPKQDITQDKIVKIIEDLLAVEHKGR